MTTPQLLKTVMAGKLQPNQLVAHHFTLDDNLKAYDTFGNAGQEHALKVILPNEYRRSGTSLVGGQSRGSGRANGHYGHAASIG